METLLRLVSILRVQARVLPPLMFMAQEPQMPGRQNHRPRPHPGAEPLIQPRTLSCGLPSVTPPSGAALAGNTPVAEGPVAFLSFPHPSCLECRSNGCSSKAHSVTVRQPEAGWYWRRTEEPGTQLVSWNSQHQS